MAVTVDVAFVQQVSDAVIHLSQQMDRKFGGTVREKPVTGKWFNAERLGSAALVKRTVRHGATQILNPEHTRRRGIMEDYDGAVLVDSEDEIKLLINLDSEYTRVLAAARNRLFDDVVIAAFNASATAVTDVAETTSAITLASFASGAHVIADGSANFSLTKWKNTKKLLDDQDVEDDGRYIALSPAALRKLLDDTQVTSADFNSVKALVEGSLSSYLGFQVIRTTRLPKTGNIRSCFAWHRDGVQVGTGAVTSLAIDKRPDLNNSMQVLAKMSLGAVRVEEARVVQIDIDESA